MFQRERIARLVVVGAAVFTWTTARATAQPDNQREPASPTMPAVRAEEPPMLDGRMDDPCWANAPEVSGFTEFKTEKPAVEQTRVRLLYDDRFIYVFFTCLEPEPEKILASVRKYDRKLRGDDYVELILDTFHDRRGKYVFMTNTLETRYDARGDVFGWNPSWDCDWKVACQVEKDRWCAEMAIPIDAMHFNKGENITWGVNFHRSEKGREEESFWSFHPDYVLAARACGDLVALNLSKVPVNRRPQFEAYVSGTYSQLAGNTETATGIDTSMRLTPHIITDFTVNPDFGQVEADADDIKLRDTERFLPERRAFFKEGAELFSTPFTVYYSRRFFDIDWGAKITGVGDGWRFGLIDVKGNIRRGGTAREGNYTVARVIRNVGESSHLGAILANSDRDDGYNRTGGLDAKLRLTDYMSWSSQALGLWDAEKVTYVDEEGEEYTVVERHDGYAAFTKLSYDRQPLEWRVALMDISKDFVPDLGFIRRRDLRGGSLDITLEDDVNEGTLKKWFLDGEFDFHQDHMGNTTLRDYGLAAGLHFRKRIKISVSRSEEYHRPYNNNRTSVHLAYNLEDPWHSISGTYTHGCFQEVPYDQVSIDKPFRIGKRFTSSFKANHRWEYPKGVDEEGYDLEDRTIWLWRWVSEYTFKWDARTKLTIENTNQNRHNITLFFSWYPDDSTDFHIVATAARSGEESEHGIFTKLVKRF